MKSNVLRRFAALLATAGLLGSLLATVAAPGIALAVDLGCTTLGGADVAGTCTVGSGTVAVSGVITVDENLVLQNGAHLDATASGTTPALTLNVTGNLTMDAGSIIEADDDAPPLAPNASAGDLVINVGTPTVTSNMTMAAGSRISADNNNQAGTGGDITITVNGDMSMAGTADPVAPFDNCRTSDAPEGLGFYEYGRFGFPDVYLTSTLGARISAHRWGGSNSNSGGHIVITVGNYGVPPSGTFTMERCSLVDASGKGPGGEIEITAGKIGNIDGLVLSESGQSGSGNVTTQPRGGGPITVFAGCGLTVSDTGVVSSKGADPGADLVLLKSCEALINGVVQSTAPGAGHVLPGTDNPNRCNDDTTAHPPGLSQGFTGCVRILGQTVTIDATAPHNGQVNVDGIRARMKGWIDIFATLDITISGDTPPEANPTGRIPLWAVEADACPVGSTGSPPCSNSFGGVITIKSTGGRVETNGQAVLQANASAIGSDGGIVTIQAGGPGVSGAGDVDLDGSFIEAKTLLSTDNTVGGTINIKSANGAVTSGGDATGRIDASGGQTAGSVTLDDCTAGDQYLGTITPGPTITDNAILGGNCGDLVVLPVSAQELLDANEPIWRACVEFVPGEKSGKKFNDVDNSGSFTAGDTPIANWPIFLLNAADNSVADGTVTATNPMLTGAAGEYLFVILAPGTYKVCEGTGPPGFVQTFPNAATTSPTVENELIVSTCPAPNVWGYEFTITGGETLEDNDFGNRVPFDCPEDRARTSLITRTVGKPGAPVPNYATLQLAYNAAKVSSVAEVIGMFSETNENVVLNNYAGPSMMITQCTTAKITALDPGKPVWDITSTKKLTIIGPDSVGGSIGWLLQNQNSAKHDLKSIRSNGASEAGVRIAVGSNYNTISFNNVASAGIGVDVLGNWNVLKSGTIGPNSAAGVHFGRAANNNKISGATIQNNHGNGVWIEGYTNTIESNKVLTNGPNGILVLVSPCPSPLPPGGCPASSGTANVIKSNQVDDNDVDGMNVAGRTNTLQDNKVSKNNGDGIEVSATGNIVKSNASNNGSPGGSSENDGFEYRFTAVSISNGGSNNKKDGSTFSSTVAGTYE